MRLASIDRVAYPSGIEQLPLEIRQSCTFLRASTMLLLPIVAIAALLVPIVMIASDAVNNPQSIMAMAARPMSTALLVAGLAIALTLMAFPLRSGLQSLGRRRRVMVSDARIAIEDRGLTGTRRWSLPLSQYRGVTHHIRATLSGPRHEIILLHNGRSGDVLLQFGHHSPDKGSDYFARLLGLPELPAQVMYGRRDRGQVLAADPGAQSAAA